MAIRDLFKLSRKTFINPGGWLDFQGLKEQNATIFSVLKSLFVTAPPAREETYEQARERLGLTEEDTQASASLYRTYALFFGLIGLVVFLYSFYLLFTKVLMGFLLGLCVAGLFFAFAFKYDFWSFQIRQRKLGATFKDWKENLLGGK